MIDDDWEPPLEIPDAKIVHYLLNVDHPKGGPKARFFLAFGFHPSRPFEFAEALLSHINMGAKFRVTDVDGRKRMIFEGQIPSPDGRNPRVRTVWQLHVGLAWRLVTAVPLT